MVRHAIAVSILLITSTARAEDDPSSSGLRVAIAPAFATLSRTTTYTGFEGPINDRAEMSADGLGGQLEIGGAGRIHRYLDLGGALRLSRLPLSAKLREDSMTSTGEIQVRFVHVAPQITLRLGRFYLRGEVALGTASSESDLPAYTLHSQGLLGLVATGLELGHRTQITRSTSVGFGLGTAVSWIRSNEDGDHGEYVDRTRVVSMTLAASLVVTP